MVSPLPFLGPGRRRPHRPDRRRARRQPDAAGVEEDSTLDLIVVGTKDALTMVEAGADEVPEDVILEALELAHARDREALRGAGGAAPPGRQAEVARPRARPRSSRRSTAAGSASGSTPTACARPARSSRSSIGELAPELDDGLDRGGHPAPDPGPRRASTRSSRRRASRPSRARARAVRGRPARAHRRRAGLEGAQVGEAPAALRPDRRDASSCRSRSARRRSRARRRRQGLAHASSS